MPGWAAGEKAGEQSGSNGRARHETWAAQGQPGLPPVTPEPAPAVAAGQLVEAARPDLAGRLGLAHSVSSTPRRQRGGKGG